MKTAKMQPSPQSFIDYTANAATSKLNHFNSIGFDCIMAGFTGKSTNHMTPEELAQYQFQTNAFLKIILDWNSRHNDVALDLFCVPQYTPADVIEKARMVFFSNSVSATNPDMFSYYLTMAGNSIAESKCGMVASAPDATGGDAKLGYFSNGTLSILGLADWTAANAVGAAGFFNTGDDYFLTSGQYTNIRQAIQIINPSAK